MKTSLLVLFGLLSVFCLEQSRAQISNLTVNGSSTSFSMTSGDTIHWHYNVSPVGATTVIEIWLDVNQNGVIDAGDVLWQGFPQTDGDPNGNNGPPDMDGVANGVVDMQQMVGLAPGKFVMNFTEGGSSQTITGTINHLASPAHTISGKVNVPAGKSAANIFLEAHRDGHLSPNFWDASTAADGTYTIEMTADTAGNPWRVNVSNNPFSPAFITPMQQEVNVVGNVTGVNFDVVAADAQVGGYLKDESGVPMVGEDVYLNRMDDSQHQQYSARTDVNGLFRIGVGSGGLLVGTQWILTVPVENSQTTGSLLTPCALFNSLSVADSLVRNLTVYGVNNTIQGIVHVNGGAPGFQFMVFAMNPDSAYGTAMCDALGNFTIPVTNKIYNYNIFPNQLGPQYSGGTTTAHPGATAVQVNVTMTGVDASNHSIPTEYSLHQNYPNPFNPTTIIGYGLPQRSQVTLAVYNTLGQRVKLLVDGETEAGYHEAKFDGAGLSSGVYFYRIQAGTFVQTKSLMLLR